MEVLDLFNNKLTAVPPCLKVMVNLKYLELDEVMDTPSFLLNFLMIDALNYTLHLNFVFHVFFFV